MTDVSGSFYDALDVSSDASTDDLEEAFREKVLETHPDKSGEEDTTEEFKRVNKAKEVLTNPKERQQYDRLGHEAYVRQEGMESLWNVPKKVETRDPSGVEQDTSTSRSGTSRRTRTESDPRQTDRQRGQNRRQTDAGRTRSGRGRRNQGSGSGRGQQRNRRGERGTRADERTRDQGPNRAGQGTHSQGQRRTRGQTRAQGQGNTRAEGQGNTRAQGQGHARAQGQGHARAQGQGHGAGQWSYQDGWEDSRGQGHAHRPEQPRGLFAFERPQGLGDTAAYGAVMTGIWLVGWAVIGLAFELLALTVGFAPIFGTFEFGVLATFSIILISRFSSDLVVDNLTVVHLALLLGMWVALLPVWYILPVRMGQYAVYGLIAVASLVWLAVIEESREAA